MSRQDLHPSPWMTRRTFRRFASQVNDGASVDSVANPSSDQRGKPGAPPAPRGSSPTSPQPPRFRPRTTWIVFALVLLGLNFYFGVRANRPPARVRVPYSPFFLQQVREGHVKSITSKGTAIQGTFSQKERYAGSKPTTRFKTEIPAFADTK